jgi:predicted PurR-regulated permease PerM
MARPTEPWSAERLRFTAVSGGLVVAALVLTTAARNLFVAAHRPLGWGLASAGVAVLLEPLVRRLSRWMKRGLAILLVMVALIVFVVTVAAGVFADVNAQVDRLEQALPVAAAQLEQDETVGGLARDFRLRDRVEMFVGDLGDRLSRRSALEGAATSVPVYFVNAVLVVFFLVWGPRFRAGFLRQLSDDDQRKRYDGIITVAARQSGRYLLAMAAQAFGAAVLTGIALWALDVPTPAALATLVGLASFVPYVGVLFGCVPALLLSGGLRPGVVTGMLAAFFIVVQVGTGLVQHRIHRWTLRVGPAATVIAAVLGSGVYGLGGAVYGALLAMFGLAVLEAAGDGGERRSVARPG